MLKICPSCHKTFSGGRLCLTCDNVALLDVADASTKPHLKEKELQHTINTYYGARTAMLLLFIGMLSGTVAAVLLIRQGFVAAVGHQTFWFIGAGVGFIGCIAVALLVGGRVVHFFSAVCRGRTPTIDDLRADIRAQRR